MTISLVTGILIQFLFAHTICYCISQIIRYLLTTLA